ncbi:MAG: SGNH/GDSL hydrolase family protein [Chthoniobacterales bacterium]
MIIKPTDTILFTGDSITDRGRKRDAALNDPLALGVGYVRLLSERIRTELQSPELTIINCGMSGNRIYDIEDRIESDLLAFKPTVVSILAGINDTWRRYDSNIISETGAFQASYRRILERVRDELGARIIILEPFLLPVGKDRRTWREDIDPKITAIRELAAEFAVAYIPFDGIFAAACCQSPAEHWLPDGVHPSPAGNALMADMWMAAVK